MEGRPDRLYYRLYVSYIEAPREQLTRVNKQSYYRVSVWDNDRLLGEMAEGSAPAILADKIFLTKAAVDFGQRWESSEIVVKLTAYFSSEVLLGIGMFSLAGVKKKYVEQGQRFNSLLEASLAGAESRYKMVFSVFVERDRYALDAYIKRFKENEKDVLRAKRNINNYKKEMLNKTIEREKDAANARAKAREVKDAKDGKVEKEEKEAKIKETNLKEIPAELLDLHFSKKIQSAGELQINSAARLSLKGVEKAAVKERKALNEAEEKEFQAYSTIMDTYNANSHFISAIDMETPSVISDGSEESEMKGRHEKETYSEKAIGRFRGHINILVNAAMVILAILLITFVITPSSTYTKAEWQRRKRDRADKHELFDI